MTERHVTSILRRMRAGKWTRGESSEEYALEHGLNSSTVRNYSAEAWRAYAREVTDPGKVTEEIAGNLAGRMQRAEDKDAAKLADVWSRVVGARAPERHTIALEEVRQYEGMTDEAKLAWLDGTIAQMQGERERVALAIADKARTLTAGDGSE